MNPYGSPQTEFDSMHVHTWNLVKQIESIKLVQCRQPKLIHKHDTRS